MDKLRNICSKNFKFENLKNIFSDKTINIYSCGPSFTEFKDKLPIDENTIKVCIKSTIFEIENPDILIYDNRIKAGLRKNHNYSDYKDIFTIYMGDYYFDNLDNYLKSLGKQYYYPINEKLFTEPNITFTCDRKYLGNPTIFKREHNNIIYGNYNIFVPLIYRLIFLFNFMGAKNFNITGHDIISNDLKSKKYFSKSRGPGIDTIMNFVNESFLDYTDYEITIYSRNSNCNKNIKRAIKQEYFLFDIISSEKEIIFDDKKLNFMYHLCKKIFSKDVKIDKSKHKNCFSIYKTFLK